MLSLASLLLSPEPVYYLVSHDNHTFHASSLRQLPPPSTYRWGNVISIQTPELQFFSTRVLREIYTSRPTNKIKTLNESLLRVWSNERLSACDPRLAQAAGGRKQLCVAWRTGETEGASLSHSHIYTNKQTHIHRQTRTDTYAHTARKDWNLVLGNYFNRSFDSSLESLLRGLTPFVNLPACQMAVGIHACGACLSLGDSEIRQMGGGWRWAQHNSEGIQLWSYSWIAELEWKLC